VLMGITAVFTIMAGAGTSCVAFAAEKFGPSMAPIAPYSWLYILFVLITTVIGVMMARATVLLIRGRANAYHYALMALGAGILIGAIHMAVSRGLRGKSMPTDMVVTISVLTLVFLLILRIPGLWVEVNFDRSGGSSGGVKPAAFTLLFCGLAILSAPLWGGASHTFVPGGFNWSNAWPLQMNLIGTLLSISGVSVLVFPVKKHALFNRFRLRDGECYPY